MKNGVICLYKEKGFTSHDAVACLRRLFGTKKIGHTGTLDPQATGVLPVLVGNAVKACDRIPKKTKVYRAGIRFGLSTDTEDVWGKIVREDKRFPEKETFLTVMESFLGEYMQIPPMVSAVKVDGKKLYEYARQGITVERKPRKMHIYRLELLSFDGAEAVLRAEVSKGTYIRTLISDLCEKAGVLGTMSSLEREESGGFSLKDTVTLSQLEEMTEEEREDVLVPTERLFEAYPVLELPPFFARLILNGCAVDVKKLGIQETEEHIFFRLCDENGFFAVGETKFCDGALCMKKTCAFLQEK